MRVVLGCLAGVLLLVPSFEAGEPRPGLRFAWPERGSATVELFTERTIGNESRSVKLRTTMRVEPAGSNGRLLVRISDPTILEVDGVPFRRGRDESESIAVARIMSRMTPSFVVSATGEYLEERDADRMVQEVLEAAGFPAIPVGMEAFEELVTRVAPSDWQAWVELWIGETLAPGEWTRRERVVTFDGLLVPVKVERRALEPRGGPGRSRLQVVAEFPSDAVRHYTVGLLLDRAIEAEQLGDDVAANREFVENARFSSVTETVTAELETETLRPLTVERTRSFFAVGGEHRVEGREVRAHRFAWHDPRATEAAP